MVEGGVSGPKVGRTVTVSVIPSDAQKLSVAQQMGRLSLTLRSDKEPIDVNLKSITDDDLNDRVEPIEKKGKTITVTKGGVSEKVQVD